MNIEGTGVIAPQPHEIVIPDYWLKTIRSIAKERAERRGYTQSADAWKRGMTSDAVIKGTLGELAVTMLLHESKIRALWSPWKQDRGDGGLDIKVKTLGLQVKTGVPWIRRVTAQKEMVPLNADLYVFCTLLSVNRVAVAGFVFKEQLISFSARRPQGHFNLVVEKTDLHSIDQLVRYLKNYEPH